MADELEQVPTRTPSRCGPPLARGAHREAVTALGLYFGDSAKGPFDGCPDAAARLIACASTVRSVEPRSCYRPPTAQFLCRSPERHLATGLVPALSLLRGGRTRTAILIRRGANRTLRRG